MNKIPKKCGIIIFITVTVSFILLNSNPPKTEPQIVELKIQDKTNNYSVLLLQPAREEEGYFVGWNESKIDQKRRTWKLWRGDPRCGHIGINFLVSGSLFPCALASYPGSGSTWLRYLIEASTGIFTGSTYADGKIFSQGYFGEIDDWTGGTTVVQKTHQNALKEVKDFKGRGILIIRNPYKAILSYHNYLFGSHTNFAPMGNYRRKEWPSFVVAQRKNWLKTIVSWVVNSKSLFIVFYEHLLQDPMKEVRRIRAFLKAPKDSERLVCLKRHLEGSFKRKRQYLANDIELFSPSVIQKIDSSIEHVNSLLKLYNQPLLPTQLYEFYNKTPSSIHYENCSSNETQFECDLRVDNLNSQKGNKLLR